MESGDIPSSKSEDKDEDNICKHSQDDNYEKTHSFD